MTKEERWKAAIEEAKPILEEVKRIRDKYGLCVLEVRAAHYEGNPGNISSIYTKNDSDTVPVGEDYGISWYDYEDETLPNDYMHWTKREDDEDE